MSNHSVAKAFMAGTAVGITGAATVAVTTGAGAVTTAVAPVVALAAVGYGLYRLMARLRG